MEIGMIQINYRMAAPDDLDEVCCLVRNAIDVMTEQNIFQWDDLYPVREDFLDDIEKGQLYVGEADHHIAVIYALNQEYDAEYESGDWRHREEPFFVIHRLCVNPAFQNRGIGKNTLKHIEEELAGKGIHSIRLDVFSKNPYALKLYADSGYNKTGHADWRKGRFYLMEKYIPGFGAH